MWTIRNRILITHPEADVRLYVWRDYKDIPNIARSIAKEGPPVLLSGHSWGVFFQARLANALQAWGVPVKAIVSADGVNKPPAAPLVVSANVLEVYSWRGTGKLIAGKPIQFVDPMKTRLVWDVLVDRPHASIDETQEFQDTVYRLATE